MRRRRGVRHERGVVYARTGLRKLKLDVYLPTAPADGPRPAILQVHGGAWVVGSRKEQGIPLLNHLAANGWVGFNVDYRMGPFHTWPAPVVDVKRAIAWVREHAEEYGVDPDFIALTGGSAGGHLTALAALTADDRSLQPGFEDADTSVQAAVPFYGVYDMLDDERIHLPLLHSWVLEPLVFKARREDVPERFRDASPTFRVHAGAPPFLVIHGRADSLVPVADARRFVERLREASDAPVVYAELRGAQHAFDFVPSARTAPMVESIERFLHTLRRQATQTGDEYATTASPTRARTNT
jgi:acetyl esterase/lipase